MPDTETYVVRAAPDAPLERNEVRVYMLATGDRDVVRAVTRQILGQMLGVFPDEVEVEYGEKGKPYVGNDPFLYYSVSHADSTAMIAVTRVGDVGIDIEAIRPVPRAATIARRIFPPDRADIFLSDPSPDTELRFAREWTRAEATVKVRGASIWEAAAGDRYVTVREVPAPAGYHASVAVASHDWRLTCSPWPL